MHVKWRRSFSVFRARHPLSKQPAFVRGARADCGSGEAVCYPLMLALTSVIRLCAHPNPNPSAASPVRLPARPPALR